MQYVVMHILININLSYILLLSSNYFITLNTSISHMLYFQAIPIAIFFQMLCKNH